MKRVLFTSLFVVSSFSFCYAQTPCAATSNIHSFTHNGKTYELVKEKKTWVQAAACAKERGGALVQIDNQAEQDAVYAAISAASVSTTYASVFDGGGAAYVWIGATDRHVEGTWKWDGNNDTLGATFWQGQGSAGTGGGAPVGGAFHNWGGKSAGTAKEPDDFSSGQDVAAIALANWPTGSSTPNGKAGEWNDIYQANSLYYIIEKSSASVPDEPKPRRAVTIFPNPADNVLNIRIADNTNTSAKVTITGIDGRAISEKLYAPGITGIAIPIDHITPGVYHIIVERVGADTIREKLVIR
jgi:hypothetical protein